MKRCGLCNEFCRDNCEEARAVRQMDNDQFLDWYAQRHNVVRCEKDRSHIVNSPICREKCS